MTDKYAFVSYSREPDAHYVERLVSHLRSHQIESWHDAETTVGDIWSETLREKVYGSSAFVVVMTPEAGASEWVNKEIDFAMESHRPILPLRLRGEPFTSLAGIQYYDVTDGGLPGSAFLEATRSFVDLAWWVRTRVRPAFDDVAALKELVATAATSFGPRGSHTLVSRIAYAGALVRSGERQEAAKEFREYRDAQPDLSSDDVNAILDVLLEQWEIIRDRATAVLIMNQLTKAGIRVAVSDRLKWLWFWGKRATLGGQESHLEPGSAATDAPPDKSVS